MAHVSSLVFNKKNLATLVTECGHMVDHDMRPDLRQEQ